MTPGIDATHERNPSHRCGDHRHWSPIGVSASGSCSAFVARTAPSLAPPDDVAREAYSHEVTSVGFWPGNPDSPGPFFYSYAYPTPDAGFATARVEPVRAFWLSVGPR